MLDILGNKEKLRENMIFYSMFLMTFENFISTWKTNIGSFFSESFYEEDGEDLFTFKTFEIVDDKVIEKEDKEAREKYDKVFRIVKKKNPKNVYDHTLIMFKWMENHGFISGQDYVQLVDIRNYRNMIAHKLEDCLINGIKDEHRQMLDSLITIRKKASEAWIRNVEIPIDIDNYLDANGNFCSPEWILSVNDIIIDIIKNQALNN